MSYLICIYTFNDIFFRGQVLPVSSLKMSTTVELIHDSVKYVLEVTKISDKGYYVLCNETAIEVDVHK